MPFVPAIAADEVPTGAVREVVLNGQTYAVANVEGTFYAVSGDCPHRNGPLGHGAVHGHHVVCPWHLWEFDLRTGQTEFGADCAIATYKTSVSDGTVLIELAHAGTA